MKKCCLRCGWAWFPRCEYPRRCPRCRSYCWALPGSKNPPRGRPSSFPVFALSIGESCFLPFSEDTKENRARVQKIKRYSKRTGKRFTIDARPGGLKVQRIYDDGKDGPI